MRRTTKIASFVILLLPLLGAGVGKLLGPGVLHQQRRELTPSLIAQADRAFGAVGATREDFSVRAPDGILLRGWKARAKSPTGNWVLLFHGVSDNRAGVLGHAEFLLGAGYSVVMMDARAHGASEGTMATYGWKERYDSQSVVDALEKTEKIGQLYALGESMGAAIALQSAGIEPRIEAVVAESSFRDLREVTYDYAGLQWSVLLGKTVFRPAAIVAVYEAEKEGGFRFDDVSPAESVARRPFPVLLICGLSDHNIPARHTEAIFRAAVGRKELWLVRGGRPHGRSWSGARGVRAASARLPAELS
ncbi:MAG TPA: alpha/beta fold hydrolase [Candidatus Acidoferrales bacterium]|nr:alpha/beta fold hydrolase [Candidatus Acidoferrales bacterium]